MPQEPGDTEYVTEIREVRRPVNTQRSRSSKSADVESDLLRDRDTGRVAGPTESRELSEEELRQRYQGPEVVAEPTEAPLSPAMQMLADFVTEVADEVAREVVLPFVREVAIPAARRRLSEAVARRRERRAGNDVAPQVRTPQVDAEGRVGTDAAIRQPNVRMTRSEHLRLQLQLKLAEDFLEDRRRLLMNAEVVDDDTPPELTRAVGLLVEGRPEDLDDETRERVSQLLSQDEEVRLGGSQQDVTPPPTTGN